MKAWSLSWLRELAMVRRKLHVGLLLLSGVACSHAANGLVPPAAESVWPQWQARVTLQTVNMSPLSVSRQLDPGGAQQRGLQGGAVLGDYYFATPSFGGFRASGGLMIGAQGGLPVNSATAGARLGLSLSSSIAPAPALGGDQGASSGTLPYLGLGFSGAPWRNGLAISADLGLVAGRGSALFGNQGFDGTLRELRLSPVLQLGVRYTF